MLFPRQCLIHRFFWFQIFHLVYITGGGISLTSIHGATHAYFPNQVNSVFLHLNNCIPGQHLLHGRILVQILCASVPSFSITSSHILAPRDTIINESRSTLVSSFLLLFHCQRTLPRTEIGQYSYICCAPQRVGETCCIVFPKVAKTLNDSLDSTWNINWCLNVSPDVSWQDSALSNCIDCISTLFLRKDARAGYLLHPWNALSFVPAGSG